MTNLPSSNDLPYMNENTPLILVPKTQQANGRASTETANRGVASSNFNFNSGAIRVAVGAALFAATNAAATALYRRNGSTVVSLYIIRSPIIYIANALIVSFLNNKYSSSSSNSNDSASTILNLGGGMSATSVLLLRTGSQKASRLALLRSLLNAIKAVFLSVGFVFLTYADAFVVFKGVATCGTLIVARKLLGTNEALAPHELACGMGVVLGILMIAPPPIVVETLGSWFDDSDDSDVDVDMGVDSQQRRLLFTEAEADIEETSNWAVRQTAGMVVAIVSGLMSSVSGTLVRMLSESGGPHDGKAPPAMLLSYLMVVMFFINGGVALVFGYFMEDVQSSYSSSSSSSSSPWAWTAFVWPKDFMDYALIATNCACTLAGHLATASGYSTTRAGIVAFLQLTEIPWVYLLDVLVLDESTTKWKSIGSAVVFVSAVAVAVLRKR